MASEIRRITGSSHLDYVMATHWHLDHMGYAGYGGIWSLLEQQGITAGALIDRDGGEWVDANRDGICDPATEVEALTSVHEVDYLLTWNCKHLANASKVEHLRTLNLRLGLATPTILTPPMLVGGGHDE